MLTYCNITTLLKCWVTCWHIATLPCCSKARWHTDILQLPRCTEVRSHADILHYYPVIQKLCDILTNRNIILLFEGSVHDIVTKLTSRGTIASKDKGSFLVHDAQTDIGTHAVFCSEGTCGYLFGGQTGGSWTLTPPTYLLGILGNNFTFLLCYSRVAMTCWNIAKLT